MTDVELLQLVREKSARELSAAELSEIRARFPHSAELRQELRRQLLLEEALVRTLGRVRVSVGDVRRPQVTTTAGRHPLTTLALLAAGWIVCGGLTWYLLGAAELTGPRPRAAGTTAATRTPATRDASPVDADRRTSEDMAPLAAPRAPAAEEPEGASTASADNPPRAAEVAASVPAPRAERPPPLSDNPWPELATDRSPLPLAARIFHDSPNPRTGLTQQELERWLAEVPGETKRFTGETRGETPVAGFEGLVRLRTPWLPDAVLRMAPFDHDGLALHVWNGAEGVSLYYYEHPQPVWAAYRTARADGEPRPARHVLLATDNERYARSLRGLVEIRHQEGTLILSRGDVRLLTVPFPDPPAEVYFDRRALFRAFSMYRGEPIPDEPELHTKPLLPGQPPAAQDWIERLASGTRLVREPNGVVGLVRDKTGEAASSHLRLPRTGLFEIVLELDDATPGMGVFLGDDAGRPLQTIGLRRERKTGAAVWCCCGAQFREPEIDGNPANERVPCCGPGQWLRIVPGCGSIKCWVSGDGRHWGRAFEPLRQIDCGFSTFGLTSFAGALPGNISLRRLHVREFAELTSLADPHLVKQIPVELLDASAGFASWCAAVLARQPAGVDSAAWRIACAVRTLAQGRTGEAGELILTGLIEDSLDRDVAPEELLRPLDQAADALDTWEAPQLALLLLAYDRVGRTLADRNLPGAYSLPGRSLRGGSIWTAVPFQTIPEHLVRAELAHLIYRDQWREVLALCERLRFWNHPARPDQSWPEHRLRIRRIVDWAEQQAHDRLGERGADADEGAATIRWRPPVAARLSKDGLNVLADLEAALAEGQYAEASRVLVATRPEQSAGLLPDPGDPRLFQSLPQVVSAAMRTHPAWRAEMVERHGTLGRVRVEQAIALGASAELEALAVQFAGTPAAAAACRWLGDRALVEGNFVAALAEYQRARTFADSDGKGDLDLKLRLTGALAGRVIGEPAKRPLSLLDRTVGAADVEQLIDELSHGDRALQSGTAAGADSARPAVAQVAWSVQAVEEWKGQTGSAADVAAGEIDWGARQLACHVSGDLLFVSNRLQVACYNLATSRRLWVQVFPGAGTALAKWPLLPFRPVVSSDRVFIRRPQKFGPGLCCIDAVSAKERWATDPELVVCSDPLLLQGQLYCFAAGSTPQERSWTLDLCTLDPQSGDIRARAGVLELEGSGDRIPSCQVALAETQLIGTIGGAVFCCDLTGRPLWLRQQTWLPAAADTRAGEQDFAPPAISGNRVIAIQPGVLELACLDIETGRLLWQLPLADARRFLGHDPERVYLETSQGVMAVSVADGRVTWRHPVEHMLDAHWLGADGTLLYARREPFGAERSRPLLVWLDAATGRERAIWPLAELHDPQPLLGPFFGQGDQLWTFFARGPNGGPRTICRLIPAREPAFPPHFDPQSVERWTAGDVDPDLRIMAARFLPDWSLVGGVIEPGAGFRARFEQQEEVLATRADREQPLLFTRELEVDAAGRPRLVIMAGHESAESWQLNVHAGGRRLLSTTVDSRSVRKNWGRWEIDLSAFAGQRVRIVVEQRGIDRPAWAYWKQLEVVP